MRTAIKKLKALFDFLSMPDDRFVSRLTAIHDKLLGNPAFPNPPVDLAAFLADITTFAASVVVSLDGSKQAIAIKNKQREGLVKIVEQVGHYLEAASNNDPVTFTSSGFDEPESTATARSTCDGSVWIRANRVNCWRLSSRCRARVLMKFNSRGRSRAGHTRCGRRSLAPRFVSRFRLKT